jgi:hypothetical protein
MMGLVSDTVLSEGGNAVGVIPSAMIAAGGEGLVDTPRSGYSEILSELSRERVSATIFQSLSHAFAMILYRWK